MNQKKSKIKDYLLLHIILLFYSFGAICSKMAANHNFLSWGFCIFYGLVLFDLAVYAVLWQQILKKFPLTIAFANKAVTIVWGILWGFLFFKEKISVKQVIGAIIIMVGICLVVSDENE